MGDPFIYTELEEIMTTGNYEWIWFVHHETSTGMLNDLNELNTLCNENQMKLCVDCISSIGAIPLDLKDVYLQVVLAVKRLNHIQEFLSFS